MTAPPATKLAQIEERVGWFHAEVWLGDGGQPAGILYEAASQLAEDVLALVEIAKAAQELHPTRQGRIVNDKVKIHLLAAALARLDGGE